MEGRQRVASSVMCFQDSILVAIHPTAEDDNDDEVLHTIPAPALEHTPQDSAGLQVEYCLSLPTREAQFDVTFDKNAVSTTDVQQWLGTWNMFCNSCARGQNMPQPHGTQLFCLAGL